MVNGIGFCSAKGDPLRDPLHRPLHLQSILEAMNLRAVLWSCGCFDEKQTPKLRAKWYAVNWAELGHVGQPLQVHNVAKLYSGTHHPILFGHSSDNRSVSGLLSLTWPSKKHEDKKDLGDSKTRTDLIRSDWGF